MINGIVHLFWATVAHIMLERNLDFDRACLAAKDYDVRHVQFKGAFLGDDVMIKCNGKYQEILDLADFMEFFGFKAKVVVRESKDIEFLSGIFPPVTLEDGTETYKYVPLPGKQINKLGWSLEHQPDFAAWYKANLKSYTTTFSIVPGLNDLLEHEYKRFSTAKDVKLSYKE